MNETFHKISTWLAFNKLSLKTDKTVYIEFGNQVGSTSKNLDINIQGTKIKRVENTKYLGIIFDSYMRWNEHCEYIYIYIYIYIYRTIHVNRATELPRIVTHRFSRNSS